MKKITVETKIALHYNCSILEFFQRCIEQKMQPHQIAKVLDCSVSNLRRIARKYNFNFYHTDPTPMLAQSKSFLKKSLTIDNFLSRSWQVSRFASYS
ncbi:hypothetical protein [Fastidiosibacter lacustris]|uniref:hypothetical protein n=1 Tax=Fastidiosibacter lacustris TaxID=2056695 RepID=UPI000E349079|nr:hypothetical protein [Fastidiosibacter lacustris]